MKIKIIKEVFSNGSFRKEGEVYNLEPKVARHYINKGIGVEVKEEKIEKQTKEEKAPIETKAAKPKRRVRKPKAE